MIQDGSTRASPVHGRPGDISGRNFFEALPDGDWRGTKRRCSVVIAAGGDGRHGRFPARLLNELRRIKPPHPSAARHHRAGYTPAVSGRSGVRNSPVCRRRGHGARRAHHVAEGLFIGASPPPVPASSGSQSTYAGASRRRPPRTVASGGLPRCARTTAGSE